MRHHLLIGGTGRAGTTFLVKYLAACGLETHLAKNPDSPVDDAAHAGLEDVALTNPNLPYVMKSPWLYEYVERVIADERIAIDAVVIPMRGIVEAASSRTLNELRARYADEDLPDELNLWETWGKTPGGIVYSLNPIDQARLLALGFHELIQVLVSNDIPVVLLDFPRFIKDPDYLYRKLRPVIGDKVDQARALSAHRDIADPMLVRVGKELAAEMAANQNGDGASGPGPAFGARAAALEFPSHAVLDRTALRRELDKSRIRIAQLGEQLAGAASQAAGDADLAARLEADLALLRARVAVLEHQLDEAGGHAARLEDIIAATQASKTELESQLASAASKNTAHAKTLVRLELALAEQVARTGQCRRELELKLEHQHGISETDRQLIDMLRVRVAGLESSRSWRLTAPIRVVSGWFKNGKVATG